MYGKTVARHGVIMAAISLGLIRPASADPADSPR